MLHRKFTHARHQRGTTHAKCRPRGRQIAGLLALPAHQAPSPFLKPQLRKILTGGRPLRAPLARPHAQHQRLLRNASRRSGPPALGRPALPLPPIACLVFPVCPRIVCKPGCRPTAPPPPRAHNPSPTPSARPKDFRHADRLQVGRLGVCGGDGRLGAPFLTLPLIQAWRPF